MFNAYLEIGLNRLRLDFTGLHGEWLTASVYQKSQLIELELLILQNIAGYHIYVRDNGSTMNADIHCDCDQAM